MKKYLRNYQEGGTYFFTICLQDRKLNLLTDYIDELRTAYKKTQNKMPFTTDAMVILPEHIHAIWTLPDGDIDYLTRIRLFKSHFSRQLPTIVKNTDNPSRLKKQEVSIWQRRYWEHTIQNEVDYKRHMDYIHFNPVKHGYVDNVHNWEYSTFHREVKAGRYPTDWTIQDDNLLGIYE